MDVPGLAVAIVGANGLTGTELQNTLKERNFPLSKVDLFRSSDSIVSFRMFDLVFLATDAEKSKTLVPRITSDGAFAIDLSSQYRMQNDVPLVVPEVNSDDLKKASKTKIISNPNCTTAQLVMALKPLQDAFGLRRVTVSSYQAISGAGAAAIDSFLKTNRNQLDCVAQIGEMDSEGMTEEERKVIEETKKILDLPDLKIDATCVRVPTINGHSESVSIEFERASSLKEVISALERMPGVKLCPGDEIPTPVQVSKKNEVYIGRVRRDKSQFEPEKSLNLWIVADNLRKGAALNAVQIAEKCLKEQIIEGRS